MANPAKTPTSKPDQVAQLIAELVPIDSIRPDPGNLRRHNDRSIDALVAALKEFGQQKPIVIDANGVIKAGSGTWQAAKRLRWQSINVVRTGLDARRADLYAVADNRIAELSFFDDQPLAAALKDVSAEDLQALGFDAAEAQSIFDQLADPLEHVAAKMRGKRTELDVMVRLLVSVKNIATIEDAITATGELNRERALLKICKAYLDAEG